MKAKTHLFFSILLCSFLICSGGCSQPPEQTGTVTPNIQEPVSAGYGLLVEGEVIPARYSNLSFSTPGSIQDVYVSEGDYVEKGQVLARLEGSETAQSAIAAAAMEVLSAEQAMQDIYDNADTSKALAQLELAQAELALEDAQENMKSKNLTGGDEQDIEAAYADYILALEEIEDAEEDFEEFAGKPDTYYGKANALNNLAKARERRDSALERWNDLKSMPDELDIAEAEASLDVANARLLLAQQEWDERSDGLDDEELEYATIRVKNAQAQLESAEQSLEDLELISPFSGTVAKSTLKIGEIASPHVASVILVDESCWQVETTDLTELDVVNVETGMPVNVTFDALPDVELSGSVSSIEQYGTSHQGDITYTVTIALDEQNERLKWKMTVNIIFP